MSPARRDLAPFVIALTAGAVILFLLVGGLAYVGRTSGPYHTSIDGSFGAQARVVVAESNALGADLRTLFGQMAGDRRIQLSDALDSLAARAEALGSDAQAADTPAPEGGAGAAFLSAMRERSEGVLRFRATLDRLLALSPDAGGSTASPQTPLSAAGAATRLAAVGRTLLDADRAYATARREFRVVPGGSALPPSVWVPQPVLWGPGALASTVDQLTSAPALAPFLDVHLVAVGITPSVLPTLPTANGQAQAPALPAGVAEVPPTCTVSVTAVVRNDGSVAVAKVPVEAAVAAVSGGPPFPVEDKVTLAPSASVAVTLPVMPVVPGKTYDVAVSLIRPRGQSRPNGQQTAVIAVAPFGTGPERAHCAHVPVGAP